MNETIKKDYRNIELNLDKSIYDHCISLKCRKLQISEIDQYLFDDADKSGLDPSMIDIMVIVSQYNKEQMEECINHYMEDEIHLLEGNSPKSLHEQSSSDPYRHILYRGRWLKINKTLCDNYEMLKRRHINTTDIDQYLLNEADKTDLTPGNIDPNAIVKQFGLQEIEQHINEYLEFEIKMRGGESFEMP